MFCSSACGFFEADGAGVRLTLAGEFGKSHAKTAMLGNLSVIAFSPVCFLRAILPPGSHIALFLGTEAAIRYLVKLQLTAS